MPSARSKLAPYFFSEVHNPIKEFLQEYKELADSNGLTRQQKVETIIHYINPSQWDIWRSLADFINQDWDDLCAELRDKYVSPTMEGHYSRQKLLEYIERSAQVSMKDESDVLKYYRNFNTLSKPLLDRTHMTIGEHNATFWLGFHPEDRQALHEWLIAKQPDKPSTTRTSFKVQELCSLATMTFFCKNHLLKDLHPTIHKTDDKKTIHLTCGTWIMTGMLSGAARHANSPPLIDVEQMTKKPLVKDKMVTNTQGRTTDAHRRM